MAKSAKKDADKRRQRTKQSEVRDAAPPPAVEVSPNVTDGTVIEFASEAMKFKGIADKSQAQAREDAGRYREVYKRAKKAGVDPDMVRWYVNNQHRDPEDIAKEFQNINRISKLMELPIGTQLGFFQDGSTVGGAVDQAKVKKQSGYLTKLQAKEDAGYRAGKSGHPKDKNPENVDSPSYERWNQGWDKGQSELLKDFGPANEGEGKAH